jgi:hypothetical protein
MRVNGDGRSSRDELRNGWISGLESRVEQYAESARGEATGQNRREPYVGWENVDAEGSKGDDGAEGFSG